MLSPCECKLTPFALKYVGVGVVTVIQASVSDFKDLFHLC